MIRPIMSSKNVLKVSAPALLPLILCPISSIIMRKVGVDVSDIRILLSGVLNIVAVSNLDEDDVRSAIEREDFKDFEDCLQDECAINIDADYIITRNTSDFRTSTINAITPEQLLDKMKD